MLTLFPTTRLKFVPLNADIKKSFNKDRKLFAKEYGLIVPDEWPIFPEAFAEKDDEIDPIAQTWGGYLFLNFEGTKIIGNGGFTGVPDESGQVEIGYEIAPEFQNIGYATEAATEMLSFALCNGARSVIAHTLAKENASNSVLKKIGMKMVKELPHDELGKVWLWAVN